MIRLSVCRKTIQAVQCPKKVTIVMKKYGSEVIKMRARWKKEEEFEDDQFTGKDV